MKRRNLVWVGLLGLSLVGCTATNVKQDTNIGATAEPGSQPIAVEKTPAHQEKDLVHAVWQSEQQHGANHLNTAVALDDLAQFYIEQKRYKDAEALKSRVLRIFQDNLGKDYEQIGAALLNLTALSRELGEQRVSLACALQDQVASQSGQENVKKSMPARGETELVQAILHSESRFGTEHLNTAVALNDLAEFYLKQKHYKDSEALKNRAEGIFRKNLGDNYKRISKTMLNLISLSRNVAQGGVRINCSNVTK